MGFKEIEVGFPSASQPDFDFIRPLIEEDLIPDDVTIQVLVQCRPELIERTYECIKGAPGPSSTSTTRPRCCSGEWCSASTRHGISDIAVNAAKLCRKLEETVPGTAVRYEYSPESFTGTEPDFAVEICEAVMDVVEPTAEQKIILNLPATVEMLHAEHLRRRHRVVRPHHQGPRPVVPEPASRTTTAAARCAAAEFGVMAGADRVEGTLFGNGERTGNVDIVTLAMNLFSQGVDPELDISDIDALRRVAEYCNRLPVHERHPVRRRPRLHGVLGFAPRRHQEGPRRASPPDYDVWEVPYLPIDPHHVGRTYEAVIRVNSQSGKGGVAYIMEYEHGMTLPRRLQIEFSKAIQTVTEDTGTEISPGDMWAVFTDEYLPEDPAVKLLSHETTTVSTPEGDRARVVAQMLVDEEHHTVQGEGNGPIDAFVHGLRQLLGVQLDVVDYSEHAVSAGADAARGGLRRDRVARRPDPLGRRHGLEHPHCFAQGRGERDQRHALGRQAVGSHSGRFASKDVMSSA